MKAKAAKARKKEAFLLRVEKGRLVPDDGYTEKRLREKGYRLGDVLKATLTKPRNVSFHRLVHVFGELVAQNIEDFRGMQAHSVLKRIQLEAGIACDEMLLRAENGMQFVHRLPRSLSFADMDEGEFLEVYREMCEFVSGKYWPELTGEQIAEMAEVMPQAA